MPIYEYKCSVCGTIDERQLSHSEVEELDELAVMAILACPVEGCAGHLTRMVSTGTSFRMRP